MNQILYKIRMGGFISKSKRKQTAKCFYVTCKRNARKTGFPVDCTTD